MWKTSVPQRRASEKVSAPTGMTMNSWKSTLESAWRAAVEDVHHGRGEEAGVDAAEVAVEGELEGFGSRRGRTAMETARMALAPSLDLFSVPSMEIMVASMRRWLEASMPVSSGPRMDSTFSTALQDAFAEIVILVSIAEFDGLVFAGGGSAGNGGAAFGSAVEEDVGFDGGITAGVKDFACMDRDDLGHVAPVFGLA